MHSLFFPPRLYLHRKRERRTTSSQRTLIMSCSCINKRKFPSCVCCTINFVGCLPVSISTYYTSHVYYSELGQAAVMQLIACRTICWCGRTVFDVPTLLVITTTAATKKQTLCVWFENFRKVLWDDQLWKPNKGAVVPLLGRQYSLFRCIALGLQERSKFVALPASHCYVTLQFVLLKMITACRFIIFSAWK